MYIKSSIIFIVLFFIVEKRKLGIQRPFLRFSNVKNPKKKNYFQFIILKIRFLRKKTIDKKYLNFVVFP